MRLHRHPRFRADQIHDRAKPPSHPPEGHPPELHGADLKEAWADLRSDFRIEADEPERLWPVDWQALQDATAALAAGRKTGE
jgi:hypothetical protein